MKRAVAIKFQESRGGFSEKGYHFFTLDDTLTIDDLVVVDTVNGFSLGKVDEILKPENPHQANKYVIQKIDFASHNQNVKEEENRLLLQEKLRVQQQTESSRLAQIKNYESIISNTTDVHIIEMAKQLLASLGK